MHTRLTALFPGLPGWASTRKVKPIWILLKQETVSGSGISWAVGICKSAPRSRQMTMPAPHHSVFTGRMPFLPPNQQHQSTESNSFKRHLGHIIFPVPSLRPAPCHLSPYWLTVPQVRPTGWDVCNRNVSHTIEDIFQRSVVDLLARQHSLLFDHPLTFTISSQHLHSHSRTSTSSPTLYCTAHWNYENCLWQVSPAEDRTFTACILLLLLLLHPFNGLFSRTTWVSQYQKGKNQ